MTFSPFADTGRASGAFQVERKAVVEHAASARDARTRPLSLGRRMRAPPSSAAGDQPCTTGARRRSAAHYQLGVALAVDQLDGRAAVSPQRAEGQARLSHLQ